MTRSFIIPIQIIPEHTVTGCRDCPDFENRGGSWGEYDACLNEDYPSGDSDIIYDRYGIPSICPRLKEQGK